jgi:hypothetical protein
MITNGQVRRHTQGHTFHRSDFVLENTKLLFALISIYIEMKQVRHSGCPYIFGWTNPYFLTLVANVQLLTTLLCCGFTDSFCSMHHQYLIRIPFTVLQQCSKFPTEMHYPQ